MEYIFQERNPYRSRRSPIRIDLLVGTRRVDRGGDIGEVTPPLTLRGARHPPRLVPCPSEQKIIFAAVFISSPACAFTDVIIAVYNVQPNWPYNRFRPFSLLRLSRSGDSELILLITGHGVCNLIMNGRVGGKENGKRDGARVGIGRWGLKIGTKRFKRGLMRFVYCVRVRRKSEGKTRKRRWTASRTASLCIPFSRTSATILSSTALHANEQ